MQSGAVRKSNKYLLWLLASFAIAGCVESFYPEYSSDRTAISAIHSFIIAALIFAWCGAHAFETKTKPIGGYRFFSAILPPFGVPTYFIKFFGFKEGLKKTIKAVGFVLLMFIMYAIPYFVLPYILKYK